MKNISHIKDLIEQADAILITAGAGMGVDSGLPDFRGDEGFWRAYPPLAKLGLSFSSIANPKWFQSDSALAWAFYGHRLNLYRETTPHKGFEILLELVKAKNENYFVFTSNVDGHFQKAGFSEEKIHEVHGSIHHLQCTQNCTNDIWSANNIKVDVDMDKFLATNIPLCPKCANVARPNILMFGDWDWNEKRALKQEARFNKWKKQTNSQKRVVIEVGAGVAIPTVRLQGEQLAKRYANTKLIRINPLDNELREYLGESVSLGGLAGIKAMLDG